MEPLSTLTALRRAGESDRLRAHATHEYAASGTLCNPECTLPLIFYLLPAGCNLSAKTPFNFCAVCYTESCGR